MTAALYTFDRHERGVGKGREAVSRAAGGQVGFTPAIGASNAERPPHVLTWNNAVLSTWRLLRDHWLQHRNGEEFLWQPPNAPAEVPVRATSFEAVGPGSGRITITYTIEEL